MHAYGLLQLEKQEEVVVEAYSETASAVDVGDKSFVVNAKLGEEVRQFVVAILIMKIPVCERDLFAVKEVVDYVEEVEVGYVEGVVVGYVVGVVVGYAVEVVVDHVGRVVDYVAAVADDYVDYVASVT